MDTENWTGQSGRRRKARDQARALLEAWEQTSSSFARQTKFKQSNGIEIHYENARSNYAVVHRAGL